MRNIHTILQKETKNKEKQTIIYLPIKILGFDVKIEKCMKIIDIIIVLRITTFEGLANHRNDPITLSWITTCLVMFLLLPSAIDKIYYGK